MERSVKACIINAYTPGFMHGVPITGYNGYKNGQKHLKRTLLHHGFEHDMFFWDDWPNDEFNKNCGYNIKASAFSEAAKMGYTHILWLDCSVWPIQNPAKIFDIINSEGWYMWRSGFNCAQTCDDNALKYFGITRDEAEKIHDCSSSMLGLNLGNPKAEWFLRDWLQSAKDGMWDTDRGHAEGSQDSRYKHDRQDQSCASVLAGRYEMNLYDPGVYSMYAENSGKYPKSVIFVMRGI